MTVSQEGFVGSNKSVGVTAADRPGSWMPMLVDFVLKSGRAWIYI
jgi:hypothetical protein